MITFLLGILIGFCVGVWWTATQVEEVRGELHWINDLRKREGQ